ncbi:RNA polymerase II associated protein 2 [Lobosporangium transversale]|uniref:RNA polymerase II subunit B1 CTD phosphatase RPAP2 homolog n=1 Tax=Lobosporangium transversale TaxID=64571 RepID=A0A1Y2GFE9_9FUNG|nr:Rtr1/RPAP2 family-domain-containing protein [Lobosporangium transversale]KAF9912654.1 RNA polymerase II associated protein 2 [Lobosporangium transversale]ORZ09341.1 Rtr1/RPAP2 family-domain-containing protein [Lobosporangium transversale]|eukprot:XP_021878794.1 Rtr1/RPAP2 family-domain-containing protein [Lobosporangium transversale]
MARRSVPTMKDDIVVDRSPLVEQYLPKIQKQASTSKTSVSSSSSAKVSPAESNEPKLTKKQILLKKNIELHKRYESMVLDWTLTLTDPVSEATLGEAANRIKQSHYQDIIEERNINKLCGYPLCSEPPRDVKGKFRISLNERKVFDISILKQFCSSRCLSASRWFESQLTEEPLYLLDVDSEHLKVARVSIVPLGMELAEFQALRAQGATAGETKPTPAFTIPEHTLDDLPPMSPQPSSPTPAPAGSSLGNEYVQSLLASVPETPSYIKIIERDTTGEIPSNPLDTSNMDQEMEEVFGDNSVEQQNHEAVDGYRVPVHRSASSKPNKGSNNIHTIENKMSRITLAEGDSAISNDTPMQRSASSTSMDTHA